MFIYIILMLTQQQAKMIRARTYLNLKGMLSPEDKTTLKRIERSFGDLGRVEKRDGKWVNVQDPRFNTSLF